MYFSAVYRLRYIAGQGFPPIWGVKQGRVRKTNYF